MCSALHHDVSLLLDIRSSDSSKGANVEFVMKTVKSRSVSFLNSEILQIGIFCLQAEKMEALLRI
jgi:hypothetical protein